MKTYLTWSVTLLVLFLPLCAYGGTIRTSVTSTRTVTDKGDIELEFKICNKGDVTAHNLIVTLILADFIKSYRELGDNPPGGEIRIEDRFTVPGLNPGKYVAIMRVDFEEQNGKLHQAYHFFGIPYRMDRMRSPGLPVSIKTDAPCFNKKEFWDKKGLIRLSMNNNGKEEIDLNIWLFLPQGFTSPEPNRLCRLTPGKTKVEEIPLRIERGGKNLSRYHLIVWGDHNHGHYSWDLKGKIKVEERPVYFKKYLMLGGALLVILFAALAVCNRSSMIRRQLAERSSPINNHQSTIDNL